MRYRGVVPSVMGQSARGTALEDYMGCRLSMVQSLASWRTGQ